MVAAEREVKALVELLSDDAAPDTTPEARLEQMSRLKLLTREKKAARALYSRAGIKTLVRYGYREFEAESTEHNIALEAQRCLANALLLGDGVDEYLLKLEAPNIATRMIDSIERVRIPSHGIVDDLFVYMRVLFVLTAKAGPMMRDQFQDENVRDRVVRLLKKEIEASAVASLRMPGTQMLFSELLKVSYNLTAHTPELSALLFGETSTTDAVWTLLDHAYDARHRELCSHTINLLSNLPAAQSATTDRITLILAILQRSIATEYEPLLTVDLLAPMMTLLCRVYDVKVDVVNAMLRERLLISDEERNVPVGRSDSLAGRLLWAANEASWSLTKSAIMTLLYALSDNDAQLFVKNVGYGHASGFLLEHGIPMPPDALADMQRETGADPVTGQNLDAQEEMYRTAMADLGEMSEEEKEREAERLFVLFQRLKENGVIQVDDPIEKAVDEGRFHEMD